MPAYVVLRDDVRRSDQQTLDAQALLICAAVADNEKPTKQSQPQIAEKVFR